MATSKSVRARKIARRIFRHENAALLLVLIVLSATLAGLTNGLTLSRDNINNVLLQSSSRGVASIGQAFVILTGGIDVSVGGIALLTANLGVALMTAGRQNIVGGAVPIALGVLVMALAGVGIGLTNGFFVSRLRVPALIVTIAMWRIVWGGTWQIAGGNTITGVPRAFAFLGQGYLAGVPMSVVLFTVLAVLAYFVLYYTSFGRSVYAVGGNPVAAWLSGIRASNIVLAVYGISGFTAALAATITASRTLTASMVTLLGLELDTIAIVCIGGISLAGGRGNLIGVIIGTIILGVINNGMNILGVDPSFQDLIKGAIILAAVTIDVVRRR